MKLRFKTLDQLTIQYSRRGILVDANLLIVFLLGSFDPKSLDACRATKTFTLADFHSIDALIGQFDRIVTTPHVLTEVSNLATKLPEGYRGRFLGFFSAVIRDRLDEQISHSSELAADFAFPRFGITDTAICLIPAGTCVVFTADFALYGSVMSRGVDAINFNHIRAAAE